MIADGPEQREADAQEASERDADRIEADEDRAQDSWQPKAPRGTPKDVHHRITGLARAVLNLMSCEGLTESEYATVNEIWTLAAILENGREDRRRIDIDSLLLHS